MKILDCKCGCEPTLKHDCAGWDVRCEKCGAITESSVLRESAIKLWNYNTKRKE